MKVQSGSLGQPKHEIDQGGILVWQAGPGQEQFKGDLDEGGEGNIKEY